MKVKHELMVSYEEVPVPPNPRALFDRVPAVHHTRILVLSELEERYVERALWESRATVSLLHRLDAEWTVLADSIELHVFDQECRFFPLLRRLAPPVAS